MPEQPNRIVGSKFILGIRRHLRRRCAAATLSDPNAERKATTSDFNRLQRPSSAVSFQISSQRGGEGRNSFKNVDSVVVPYPRESREGIVTLKLKSRHITTLYTRESRLAREQFVHHYGSRLQ